jgi:hypothetical protein
VFFLIKNCVDYSWLTNEIFMHQYSAMKRCGTFMGEAGPGIACIVPCDQMKSEG